LPSSFGKIISITLVFSTRLPESVCGTDAKSSGLSLFLAQLQLYPSTIATDKTSIMRHDNIVIQQLTNINAMSIALADLGPTTPPPIIVSGETSDIWWAGFSPA